MQKNENRARIKNTLRLAGRLKEYRLNMAGAVLAGIGHQLSTVFVTVAGAWIVGLALDGGFPGQLQKAILITFGVVVAKIVFYFLEMWIAHDVAFKVLADFRVKLYDAIEKVSPAILLDMRSGQLASTMMSDVELLEWFFAHSFGSILVAVIVPAILMIWLGTIVPILPLVLLVFILLAVMIPGLMKKKADDQGKQIRDQLGDANAVTMEGVQGMREILVLNYCEIYRKKNADCISKLYKSQLEHGKRLGTEGALLQLVLGLSGIVSAFLASRYVGQSNLDSSTYTVIVVLSGMILGPVIEICNTARNFGLIFAAADRVYRVLEAKPVVADTGADCDVLNLQPSLSFEHVTFCYRKDLPPAVKDLSFRVEPGETVALVGASGAGKSTCIQLMMRYWDPASGRICIGEKELREMSIRNVNEMISAVLQDVYLFRISIRENIRLGRPDATDEEVEMAAKMARAHEFIAELPQGYDTVCGESGVKLSGGQRQRVAIARAFLKDAPILIMDEAVSNLDTENEKAIQDSLRLGKKKKTIVVVAHRLSTIQSADKVIVLKKGELIYTGPYSEKVKELLAGKESF